MIKTEIDRPYFPIVVHYREGDKDDEAVIKEMFEENVYRLDSSKLSKKPVVLDIGANIGTFTLLTLKIAQESGKQVTVYAVEPEQKNLALLKQNLAANPGLFTNGSKVHIITEAISDFRGAFNITSQSGGSRLSKNAEQPVNVITYDDFLKDYNIERVDFTKIDIEGSEVFLLSGASKQNILKSHYYAVEFDRQNTSQEFVKMLQPFLSDFSFETWGIPAKGCNLYLENHHWGSK